MNNKTRKLRYIRYKNKTKSEFPAPKWSLKGKQFPLIWMNNSPGLLEDSFVVDLGFR